MTQNFNKKYNKGFTLTELLVSIFIISILTVIVNKFASDVFVLSNALSSGMSAQFDARHVIKQMVTEIRTASPSGNGSYSIDTAATSTLIFYSDINNNGTIDRVRYFLSGKDLKKGVIAPSGNPVTYTGTENISTLITGLVSSSTAPIFQYYPSTYYGTTSPISSPVPQASVRLVKITVIIDKDPTHAPTQIVVTSQVSLRNLKDNQ